MLSRYFFLFFFWRRGGWRGTTDFASAGEASKFLGALTEVRLQEVVRRALLANRAREAQGSKQAASRQQAGREGRREEGGGVWVGDEADSQGKRGVFEAKPARARTVPPKLAETNLFDCPNFPGRMYPIRKPRGERLATIPAHLPPPPPRLALCIYEETELSDWAAQARTARESSRDLQGSTHPPPQETLAGARGEQKLSGRDRPKMGDSKRQTNLACAMRLSISNLGASDGPACQPATVRDEGALLRYELAFLSVSLCCHGRLARRVRALLGALLCQGAHGDLMGQPCCSCQPERLSHQELHVCRLISMERAVSTTDGLWLHFASSPGAGAGGEAAASNIKASVGHVVDDRSTQPALRFA